MNRDRQRYDKEKQLLYGITRTGTVWSSDNRLRIEVVESIIRQCKMLWIGRPDIENIRLSQISISHRSAVKANFR